MSDLRLWHGGVPGLRPGDTLTGGNERRLHDGCPYCQARATGGFLTGPDGSAIDAPSAHPDRVYVTTDREYARFYASLWGRGDLYRVEPASPGDIEPSPEDHFLSWTMPAARVVAVYARAVTLTMSQRRTLLRRWQLADAAALSADEREPAPPR